MVGADLPTLLWQGPFKSPARTVRTPMTEDLKDLKDLEFKVYPRKDQPFIMETSSGKDVASQVRDLLRGGFVVKPGRDGTIGMVVYPTSQIRKVEIKKKGTGARGKATVRPSERGTGWTILRG